MKKKIIAVFTGNRAEYGLLLPILNSINNCSNLDFKLIVSGSHLENGYGKTISEIKNDNIPIFKKIHINQKTSTTLNNVQSIGHGIVKIAKVLYDLKPDFMLVYGDRFETLAAAIASTQMLIPTIHIEGGDLTQGGTLDDNIRHAISKLSHLHLTTNLLATKRLIQMGEESWRIKIVGLPSLDKIVNEDFESSENLIKKFQISSKRTLIIFTQHSVASQYKKTKTQIKPSIEALKYFAAQGMQVIVTYPNNDLGGDIIISELKKLEAIKYKNIKIYRSLGSRVYHGLLSLRKKENFDVICVGNSSSGIKETPVFNCPTVNIGSRQDGRLRAKNVIDVGYNKKLIINAIKKCIYDEEFKKQCVNLENPYYFGNVGQAAIKFINSVKINEKLLTKKTINS